MEQHWVAHLAESVKQNVEDLLRDAELVRPTTTLQQAEVHSQSCGGLTMCPTSCRSKGRCTVHHFYVSELQADLKKALKSKITPTPCAEAQHCNCTWTTNYTLSCISNASDCLRRLLGSTTSHKIIRNEQELRYAVGDPILNMICDMGPCKVFFITLL